MKKTRSTLLLLIAVSFLGFTFKNNKHDVKFLDVPGPLLFDSTYYDLAWSSHPSDNYYTQEYIPEGDSINNFNKMILINVMFSDSIKLDDVVASEIADLTKMQKENPVIQFKAYENKETNEHMIDFLLSQNELVGDHLKLVERNVYRYKQFTNKSGQKGILLFGVSTRSYGNDIYNFFDDLKEHRTDMVTKVGNLYLRKLQLQNKKLQQANGNQLQQKIAAKLQHKTNMRNITIAFFFFIAAGCKTSYFNSSNNLSNESPGFF